MDITVDTKTATKMIRLRLGQMIINERFKNKEFKIPIHLALGHEAIAVAVDGVMAKNDQLLLPHRNIHYNLARSSSFRVVLDEFYLNNEGVGGARLGSMNLSNEGEGIVYTSSILGNNLGVAAGSALGMRVKQSDGVVFVVTGDGAMEEGSFYESLLFMKSYDLGAVMIVEDNGWSLATQIHERRCNIDLGSFANALDLSFIKLEGNDPYKYITELTKARSYVLEKKAPMIVEVKLQTLGDWRLKNDEFPDGKYINYHAGPAPSVELNGWPLIRENESDPVFVLQKYLSKEKMKDIVKITLDELEKEIK